MATINLLKAVVSILLFYADVKCILNGKITQEKMTFSLQQMIQKIFQKT